MRQNMSYRESGFAGSQNENNGQKHNPLKEYAIVRYSPSATGGLTSANFNFDTTPLSITLCQRQPSLRDVLFAALYVNFPTFGRVYPSAGEVESPRIGIWYISDIGSYAGG